MGGGIRDILISRTVLYGGVLSTISTSRPAGMQNVLESLMEFVDGMVQEAFGSR